MKVTLLDLAGDSGRARTWLDVRAPGADVVALDKAEMKAASKREMLSRLRARGRTDLFAIFCNRLDLQPARALMLLFGWLSGARRVAIGDMQGGSLERSGAGVL